MLSCRDHHSRAVVSPVGRQVLLRCLRPIFLLRRSWLVVSVSQQRGSGNCPVFQLLLRFSPPLPCQSRVVVLENHRAEPVGLLECSVLLCSLGPWTYGLLLRGLG